MANEDAPHIALILVRAEVYEQNPNGEFCGGVSSVYPEKERYIILPINGSNKENCLQKLKEKIEEIRNVTKT